jgi:hypothetical protein
MCFFSLRDEEEGVVCLGPTLSRKLDDRVARFYLWGLARSRHRQLCCYARIWKSLHDLKFFLFNPRLQRQYAHSAGKAIRMNELLPPRTPL